LTYYGFPSQMLLSGYVIGHERMSEMLDELKVLHAIHFQETETLYLDQPCDPDYDRWRALEDLGQFVVFTVRNTAGELVGYLQYYVFRDMHSKEMYVAREDALFLLPEHRGGGIASKLIDYAEHCLKQLGCAYAGMSNKGPVGGPDIGNFLERKGYRPVAMYYSKKL
jgi:GNAT superfamily N-acetyltransferase